MATHAEIAARLLRDAAAFFETVGSQNPALQDAMAENAEVFTEIADLVEHDPLGQIEDEE
jgi:c-di-AMP phosphodiesterase-like protein